MIEDAEDYVLPTLEQNTEALRNVFDIAQEEAAEVIKAISKIKRFGFEDLHNVPTKRVELEAEIGDFIAIVNILTSNGVLSTANIDTFTLQKLSKLKTWAPLIVPYIKK